jgi:hypothetical protein
LPLAMSYFLLWHPPASVQGDMNLFFFLVACNVSLRISLTLFLVPAYAFVAGLHRFIPRSRQHVIQQSVGPKQFYVQVRDVLRSPPIRSVMMSGILFWAASGTYTALWVYIYSYFWEFTSQQIALIAAPMVLSVLICTDTPDDSPETLMSVVGHP